MALLAMAMCALVMAYAPSWLGVAAVIILGTTLWLEGHRGECWELRWVPGSEGGWQGRGGGVDEWRDTSLSCEYLGHWLIGLRVGGRRYWLWPDSASQQSQRSLRRLLLWSSPGR